ncbi:ferredoxin FdxA [Burkholderia ubonensis]|uniref:Ferredoxin n=1 Tax=Burkholderia ubonensis TaxID=101571 RepID=A0A107EB74_9BURK|nr:ferredoxin FdxA [Burkholderia ubonensis]KWD71969.1 ferredoxin [Burkholderia ubonensis]KWD84642.1 ferredoxin [Burkholderia ubonensis]KWD94090.1 ferredoxin [Burkholderia ubonensis]KWD96717.1 ferredoxin [Burkholderia ubonensis]
MAYVVTENCINCKHTDCVEVCPVDCFHEGENFLVIDPDECIDCGVCEPECPVGAIRQDVVLDADQVHYASLNRELAQSWPTLTIRKPVLPDAAQWKDVEGKFQQLKRDVIA